MSETSSDSESNSSDEVNEDFKRDTVFMDDKDY